MQRFICLVFGVGVAIFLGASVAMAQGTTWVQIEARPTEAEAEARAAAYSGRLDSVNGFRLSSGWYAIALGPFSRDEAEITIRRTLTNRLSLMKISPFWRETVVSSSHALKPIQCFAGLSQEPSAARRSWRPGRRDCCRPWPPRGQAADR